MTKHLTLFLMLFGLVLAAQAKIIKGTVTDQNGETIISASVMVQGTSVGTITDLDGNYELDVPDEAKTLVVSYLGYKTSEVTISDAPMKVVLVEDNQVLDEVVVTGYGTTKKRDLVTSVASVGADQLKDIPVTTAAEALQGKLAGVQVTATEGSPDAEMRIVVRGGTSLTQSNEPLYIVDGFPVNSIADISPNDIQSIDVLKDAAATAIYGAKGANGVIMITTKETKFTPEEKKNTLKVHADYTGYMGWRTMAGHYNMMNNEDYLRMQYEYMYLSNKGHTSSGQTKLRDSFFKPYNTYNPAQGRYYRTPNIAGWERMNYVTDEDLEAGNYNLQGLVDFWNNKGMVDWQDELYGGRHLNSNHTFSFDIANKLFSLALNYNRIDDKSLMYGSNFDRNNVGLKFKVQPVKGLTIGLNARYVNTNVLGSGSNSLDEAKMNKSENRLRSIVTFIPLYGLPVQLIDNKTLEEESEENVWSIFNPYTSIDDNYKTKIEHKWNINGYVAYKFLNHFTVRVDAGYEGRVIDQRRYYGMTTSYSRYGDGYAQAGINPQDYLPYAHAQRTYTETSRFKETNTFEYAQKFRGGRHDLTILVGEEQIINKGQNINDYHFGMDRTIAPSYLLSHINEMVQAKPTISKTYIYPNDNMLSFFARANYVLYGRYYFTATFRADASTKFAKGNQWGFFPSAAIAWRMIDEKWMAPAQDVMSNWKWRLSYGTVGNNNIDLGILRANYVFDNLRPYLQDMNDVLIDGKNTTDGKLTAANPNLKWETTTTRDFGMDFGFFNERLSGTIDLYWNTTKDLLLRYVLSTGGYNYQYRNIGSTDNKGVEFSIRGVILDKRTKNLSYGLTVGANLAHNKNTVVSLGGMESFSFSADCPGGKYNQSYEYYLQPGASIGDIYGYRSDGFYTVHDFDQYNNNSSNLSPWEVLKEDGTYAPVSTKLGLAYPGMRKLKSEELVKIGNTLPIISGGFNLSWFVGGEKWGKIDMSANFTYSYGNDVVNMTALDFSMINSGAKNRNLLAMYANHYTLFTADGSRIGEAEHLYQGVAVRGDNYQHLAQLISEANADRQIANPYSENNVLTDEFIEDGSFLRLNSLTIGYSLPEVWLKKAHISTARVFFSASNLFCITKYSGLDPESDTRTGINPLAVGMDFAAFPRSRGFNFGLNLAF